VYTVEFLRKQFLEGKRAFPVEKGVIIVPTFDIELIRKAITSILKGIQYYSKQIIRFIATATAFITAGRFASDISGRPNEWIFVLNILKALKDWSYLRRILPKSQHL